MKFEEGLISLRAWMIQTRNLEASLDVTECSTCFTSIKDKEGRNVVELILHNTALETTIGHVRVFIGTLVLPFCIHSVYIPVCIY